MTDALSGSKYRMGIYVAFGNQTKDSHIDYKSHN